MKFLKTLRVALLTAIAGVVFCAAPAKADLIVDPVSMVTVTNLAIPSLVTTNTTSNLVQQVFYVNPGYDLGLEAAMTNGANATTLSNATITVKAGNDRTNWPVSFSLTKAYSSAGTVFGTNFPANLFSGYRYVEVSSVLNNDTNNTVNIGYIRLSRRKITQ